MRIPSSIRVLPLLAWLAAGGIAASGAGSPPDGAASFFFRNGDRIVFVGDSITVEGGYVRYIENFIRTRFPDWIVAVRNAGINGQIAQGGFEVIDTDVLTWNPTVVIINYGMNDGRRRSGGAELYQAGIVPYVDKLLAKGIRAVLCSNTPVDIGDKPGEFTGHNQTFLEMATFAAGLARQRGIPFVDQFGFCHRVWGENRRRAKPIPVSHQTLVPYPSDFVHARGPGQLTMAYIILKTLGAPGEVSSAEIDVSTGKTRGRRSQIAGLEISADRDRVSFTRADLASPCWIDDRAPFPGNLGLELVPFREEMNRMPLVVSGLAPGRYELTIDGYALGVFSAAQLAAGIDLAADARNPLFEVGRQVDARVRTQAAATYAARQVRFFRPPSWLKIPDLQSQQEREFSRRMGSIEAFDATIRMAAAPRARTYRLKRIDD